MRSLQNLRAESLMAGDSANKGNRIMPGHMYMYMYNPKHKDTLPYYDMFPLVFPFRQVQGGFYGLNMHYLPYHLRAMLLDRLMEFKTNKAMDERTRLRLSWQTIGATSRFAAAAPCVKHYLYQQVASPFKAIHSDDWATAIMLPVEKFSGATRAEVWADSLKKIRNF